MLTIVYDTDADINDSRQYMLPWTGLEVTHYSVVFNLLHRLLSAIRNTTTRMQFEV